WTTATASRSATSIWASGGSAWPSATDRDGRLPGRATPSGALPRPARAAAVTRRDPRPGPAAAAGANACPGGSPGQPGRSRARRNRALLSARVLLAGPEHPGLGQWLRHGRSPDRARPPRGDATRSPDEYQPTWQCPGDQEAGARSRAEPARRPAHRPGPLT